MFPNAKVKSDKLIANFSIKSKERWDNPEYKKKQIEIRNITHKDPNYRKKISDILKKKFEESPETFSGLTSWSKTDEFKKWVKSPERIKKISKTSKERWEDPEYKSKTIETIKNKLNDGRCKKSLEFREKMSEKISELYSLGILKNEKNKYKTGVYKSHKNEEFIYSSSYELEAMKLFDNTKTILNWTNKHGIRIKYFFNDLNRHYVPDFKVEFLNGITYIIEMKGWDTEEVKVKTYYAKKIYPNYRIFYTINDLKKFLDENS
jgi:hypothetical protein